MNSGRLRCLQRLARGAVFASLSLAGCAGYDGRGLIAGKSDATEVEALMGQPAARATSADGGSVLYFPRPAGRQTFVARLGRDGILRGIEPVLTRENINTLIEVPTPEPQLRSSYNAPNARTGFDKAHVRALFGPPGLVSYLPLQAREVWEYKWIDTYEPRVLWVYFSDDGILREVTSMRDFSAEPPGGRRGRR